MPTLYVVATPIGNLSDFSPHAIEVLKSVSLIAAEDTRVTMKLLAHFDIHTPLTSCHEHNEAGKGEYIVRRMLEEQIDVALTTDAGTPAISDPGCVVVREAAQNGIEVIAVAGPTAMAAALSVSGLDTREFAFYGFLPRNKKELSEKLRQMSRGPKIAVVHESPYRVLELLETVAETLPQTAVSVSCDLTKLHELTLRGNIAEVLRVMMQNPKAEKGEYCICLDFTDVPASEEAPRAEISVEAQLFEHLLSGESMRDAMSTLKETGIRKNELYAASLRVKELLKGEDE